MKPYNEYHASESIRNAIAREIARQVRVKDFDALLALKKAVDDAQDAYREAIRKAAETAFE